MKLMNVLKISLLTKVRDFKNLLEYFRQLNLNSNLIKDKNKNNLYSNLFQGHLALFFHKNGEIF
jgi:16S rRNA G527 N7-methylase RsmG